MNRNKKMEIQLYNIYVIPITSFKWRSKSKKLIVILLDVRFSDGHLCFSVTQLGETPQCDVSTACSIFLIYYQSVCQLNQKRTLSPAMTFIPCTG